MKAIILKEFGSADNFELAEIPIPAIKNGEVRIKIKAISFNPVDYQARKGGTESKSMKSNILGRDLSGVIDEVDAEVHDFQKGDEVYCYVCSLASGGTYAEYVSVPSELVAKKPVSLSHEQAAAVPVAAITAWMALAKTNPGRSKSVFIAGGAGGVGTFVIMFAKHLGFKNMITTSGNEKSLNYLINELQLMKEQIINYKDDDFIKNAIAINSGYFEIVIDLVGGKMLSACCELLDIDADLASVTDPPGKDEFEFLFARNASFHSIGANAYSLTDDKTYWKKYREFLNHFAMLFDSAAINKPPVTIVGAFSVDTVRKAHEIMERGSVQGKLVMGLD